MLIQKLLFIFLGIAVITIIALTLNFKGSTQDSWMKNLSPQEKRLNTLVMGAVITKEEIDMKKALYYYMQREAYCQSLTKDKERCLLITKPFWEPLYKDNVSKTLR